MIDLDAIEARANAATPGPWKYCADSDAIKGTNALIVRGARSNSGPFIAHARTDVPALIARVRELEAERDACARSHLILKAIHGALTDALPSTPIPALDSFDVVELVRKIAKEGKP
jgi:hypothetical protein